MTVERRPPVPPPSGSRSIPGSAGSPPRPGSRSGADSRRGSRTVPRLLLRAAVSLAALALLARFLELDDLPARLASMDPRWVAAALAVTVGQTLLSAWRWRFTAGRLGIGLPLRRATGEYYLASFLNQLLPGGVAGDLSRAWRHGRWDREAGAGPAFRAVLLERASGQAVMLVVAVTSGAFLVGLPASGAEAAGAAAVLAAAGGAGALFLHRLGRRQGQDERADPGSGSTSAPGFPDPPSAHAAGEPGTVGAPVSAPISPAGRSLLAPLPGDARRALLARDALPIQAITSLLVVGSYLAVFLMAARAVGIDTPVGILLPLVAPVLLAMLLPVTLAGWGAREGAAALAWSSVGLPASEGVAASVAYGLLVLVSTLPGALLLPSLLHRGPRSPGGALEVDPPRGQPEDATAPAPPSLPPAAPRLPGRRRSRSPERAPQRNPERVPGRRGGRSPARSADTGGGGPGRASPPDRG